MTNSRFRGPSDDELADYRGQEFDERYDLEQRRKEAAKAALHPHDPDFVSDELPDESESATGDDVAMIALSLLILAAVAWAVFLIMEGG